MAKYLISFPSEAMKLREVKCARAGVDSRAAIEQAKAVGVFGSGINESVNPVLVASES